MVVPLGLSGALFSTMAFFAKYQWWFVGISVGTLAVAHYLTWKRRHVVPRTHVMVLWAATFLTLGSVMFVLYTYGYI
ncbi:hypothetical protein JCM14719A_20230 [Calditerricola satsumensis]|uniref:Uncharacterized protein n=1 Tax=Calditerricola satsumensis TaxID=373054 RepID=A0A8J3B5E4_9BACI|nr:hypothetical protein GCM10007043_08250 [Calditerricola satsumensis]